MFRPEFFVEYGRCFACGEVIVDAWACESCSFVHLRDDDERAPTASARARARQLTVDIGGWHEQMRDLAVVGMFGVATVGDPAEATRAARTRMRLHRASNDVTNEDGRTCAASPSLYSPFRKVADRGRRAARRARQPEAA